MKQEELAISYETAQRLIHLALHLNPSNQAITLQTYDYSILQIARNSLSTSIKIINDVVKKDRLNSLLMNIEKEMARRSL